MQYLRERRCNIPETFPALFPDELFRSGCFFWFVFYVFCCEFCVNAVPLLLRSQLLRSSLVNNRTQAKVAEELGMQEFAITNDKTKRPVVLRTKTLADLLECKFTAFIYDTQTDFPGPSQALTFKQKVQVLISLLLLCLTPTSSTSLLQFFFFMWFFYSFFGLFAPTLTPPLVAHEGLLIEPNPNPWKRNVALNRSPPV